MADPTKVITGPGLLSVAPVGTAEPASAAALLGFAFTAVGWTGDGETFTAEQSWNAINVEEEIEPIRWEPGATNDMLAFQMAETTKKNLGLALNMGAVANDAVGLEPPSAVSMLRVMLVLDTVNGARWVFRRCIQTGSIAMAHKTSPDKRLIPVSFRLESVSPAKRWIVYPSVAATV